MTPEGTIIDGGLGSNLLTPVLFTCGLCPDHFRPGAVLVADPGAVAVISVGFTMCMVAPTLDTLPRLALNQGFLFLLDGQHRGRIAPLYRKAHHHR